MKLCQRQNYEFHELLLSAMFFRSYPICAMYAGAPQIIHKVPFDARMKYSAAQIVQYGYISSI